MKEILARNLDSAGNVNSPTVVVCVVVCGMETGATRDTLCISAIVACVYGMEGMEDTETLLLPRTDMISFRHLKLVLKTLCDKNYSWYLS